MAIVHNTAYHRVELRLYEMTDGLEHASYSQNVAGTKTARRVGPPGAVILNVGRNEVDDDFFAEWYAQNENCPLVASGTVIWEDRPKVEQQERTT